MWNEIEIEYISCQFNRGDQKYICDMLLIATRLAKTIINKQSKMPTASLCLKCGVCFAPLAFSLALPLYI